MPSTIIHDPLGLITGIKVTNVRSVMDRERDCILIQGRMSGDHVVGSELEPDVQCDIVNRDEQICLSASSVHQGVYSVTKKVTFTLQIEEVSRDINWDDITRLDLYVIFRKNRSLYDCCKWFAKMSSDPARNRVCSAK